MSSFLSSLMSKLYGKPQGEAGEIYFFNTLTKKKEKFEPLRRKKVGMYHCGPTVYNFAHIGNLRAYVFADLLKRLFLYEGFEVKQVINITDVGHLTDDADQGEDKIEEGAKREGKSAKEIAEKFTAAFMEDIAMMNVNAEGTIFPKATEHITEQIAFIQTLEEKGYTYKTSDGIYFNSSLFKKYGALGGIDIKGLSEGARVEKNPERKHPTDFALWKFSPKENSGQAKRQQEWPSPWGLGFPGWHIECSAMSIKYLGKTFDIHTGGIDHIPVHHNNEIAQSESATGRSFVRYWLHNEHLKIEGRKISKSLGNTIYLKNIIERRCSPLALRYLFLSSNYRAPQNFTWESLEGAQNALFKAHRHFVEELGTKNGKIIPGYKEFFTSAIRNDLDSPKALSVMWELIKDAKVGKPDKRTTLLDFDRVLGLGFLESNKELLAMSRKKIRPEELPAEVRKLFEDRELARQDKDFKTADLLRAKISASGFELEDTPAGPKIYSSRAV